MDDFYVDGRGAGEFGARLLASYTVGGPEITRDRVLPPAGLRFVPAGSQVGLREIVLPIHLYGASPSDAQRKKSALDAALLADPVELALPDGFLYRASLDKIGDTEELTPDGCILAGKYTLVGCRHDLLERVTLPAGGGILCAKGTAPDMECRLTATATAASLTYVMAGVVWVDVSAGDVLCLDGLNRIVTRNGVNALDQCDLTRWPLLAAGRNVLTCPDALTVEYYPIWL